jgi:methyl-accepting chemotaxis protein
MKSNMRLTLRMVLAFGLLVVVILLLGVIGIASMERINRLSNTLANESVPEISLANDIERGALSMIPSLQDYGYTDDETYLGSVRAQLGELKKYLASAKAQGTNSAQMQQLQQVSVACEKTIVDFEALTEQRSRLTAELAAQQTAALSAGSNFVNISRDFWQKQNEALLGKIRAEIDGDQLESNLNRITCLGNIVQLGNVLLGNTWKALSRRDPAQLSGLFTQLDTIGTQLDELQKLTDFENDRKRIADCRASQDAFRQAVKKFQEKWTEREALAKRQTGLAANVVSQAKNVASLGLANAVDNTRNTAAVTHFSVMLAFICVVLGVILGVVLSSRTIIGISRLIRRITDTLSTSNQQVSSISEQLSNTSEALASASSKQAASLEETSSSLSELSSMTRQNSESAQQAHELTRQARSAANKGVEAMTGMSAAMLSIQESSDDISKIIKTIDEIAFQTNILALNAAVEAARAGEAGMGFAVVADEVRNLAQRSAQSARETTAKIENAIQRTSQGVQFSRQVAGTLNEIVDKVTKVDELVSRVAEASREQTVGINQINTAVGHMDLETQNNAASTEESAAAASLLHSEAEVMRRSVLELLEFVESEHKIQDAPASLKAGQPVGKRRVPVVKPGGKGTKKEPALTV